MLGRPGKAPCRVQGQGKGSELDLPCGNLPCWRRVQRHGGGDMAQIRPERGARRLPDVFRIIATPRNRIGLYGLPSAFTGVVIGPVIRGSSGGVMPPGRWWIRRCLGGMIRGWCEVLLPLPPDGSSFLLSPPRSWGLAWTFRKGTRTEGKWPGKAGLPSPCSGFIGGWSAPFFAPLFFRAPLLHSL